VLQAASVGRPEAAGEAVGTAEAGMAEVGMAVELEGVTAAEKAVEVVTAAEATEQE